MPFRTVRQLSALGAMGGAVNAALAFTGVPILGGATHFEWHIILAGACHGALLAGIAGATAALLQAQPLWQRWLAAPVVGWVAGWLSWVPMQLSIHSRGVLGTLSWPFADSLSQALIGPLRSFGLVSLLLYGGLALSWWGAIMSRPVGLSLGVISGVAGSLWFWCGVGSWPAALIHGAIWGALVGFGLWRSQEAAR
jgi:hypothetical protein